MYNGIGLTTARGSGTNGFVTRNLSAVRKTKEKVPEYSSKDDAAVRPFDIELIEHERRRQAEVRCLELQELLEEEGIPEDEITEKVNAFRAKLLAERKSGIARDSSGRPIPKDSHEVSMAQEAKNEKAKDAFGIRADFVPGSSMVSNNSKAEKATGEVALEIPKVVEKSKSEEKKKKKRSHKRRASTSSSSSSSSGSSSDEETRRKRKKKEKKKKSKKSHHHHKRSDRSRSREKDRNSPVVCACENDGSSSSSYGCLTHYSIHSSSTEDEETDHHQIQLTSCLATIVNLTTNGDLHQSSSPFEIISLPMNYGHPTTPNKLSSSPQFLPLRIEDCSDHSKSPSPHSQYSRSSTRSRSRSSGPKNKSLSPPQRYRSNSRSRSKSRSRTRSGSNLSRSSGSDRSRTRSATHSPQPESRQHSRSHSRSSHSSSSSSTKSNKTRSRSSSRSVSIPRRRGSPSFLDRRRITSARKRPVPYKRREGSEYDVSTSSGSGANDTDSESDFSD